MVRNTDWSRDLLDQTAHFGQFPPNMTTEQVCCHALSSACLQSRLCCHHKLLQPSSTCNSAINERLELVPSDTLAESLESSHSHDWPSQDQCHSGRPASQCWAALRC